jgi:hypothetical protein
MYCLLVCRGAMGTLQTGRGSGGKWGHVAPFPALQRPEVVQGPPIHKPAIKSHFGHPEEDHAEVTRGPWGAGKAEGLAGPRCRRRSVTGSVPERSARQPPHCGCWCRSQRLRQHEGVAGAALLALAVAGRQRRHGAALHQQLAQFVAGLKHAREALQHLRCQAGLRTHVELAADLLRLQVGKDHAKRHGRVLINVLPGGRGGKGEGWLERASQKDLTHWGGHPNLTVLPLVSLCLARHSPAPPCCCARSLARVRKAAHGGAHCLGILSDLGLQVGVGQGRVHLRNNHLRGERGTSKGGGVSMEACNLAGQVH